MIKHNQNILSILLSYESILISRYEADPNEYYPEYIKIDNEYTHEQRVQVWKEINRGHQEYINSINNYFTNIPEIINKLYLLY